MNYATLSNDKGTNRKDVEWVINQIIADIGGFDISEITAEKKICDDLLID